ncbi:MAG: hypothetical protein JWO36_4769, partial [Myxococcales bacterium]|nr:hypothetical protein [Myxococcales bacterium]
NCLAGDKPSCRALPSYESNLTFAAPGAAGRSEACRTAAPECDHATLQRECAEGFGASCHAWRFLGPPDLDALEARELPIVVEGCRDGLIDECKALEVTKAGDATRIIAYEQVCKLTHDQCAMVAHAYQRAGASARARDMLERTCQYVADELAACLELADGYRTGKYPEPVPGRGTALRDWACPRLPKVVIEGNTFPICKP